MKVLLSNDDGIYAKGLRVLHRHLSIDNSTVVVAPDQERSAISHAISLEMPIRSRRVILNNGDKAYAVSGTPADCIKLATIEIMDERPDIMISGINPGANTGILVNYSGTVAAAREATLYGIPAISVSIMAKLPKYYDQAAHFVERLAKKVVKNGLPKGTLLNVNIPNIPMNRIRGVQISKQNMELLGEKMKKRLDPRKRPYYWHAVVSKKIQEGSESDVAAVAKNFIAITPIKCDATDYDVMHTLKKWGI